MKSELWLTDKRKWKLLKTKWLDSTQNSSRRDWTRFKLLRMLLRKHAIKFSRGLKLKSCRDLLKRSSRKILETNFTTKRVSLLQGRGSKLSLTSVNEPSKNCRRPRSSKWGWRRNERLRNADWRRTSSWNFNRSLLRTNVLSRWMRKREGCVS